MNFHNTGLILRPGPGCLFSFSGDYEESLAHFRRIPPNGNKALKISEACDLAVLELECPDYFSGSALDGHVPRCLGEAEMSMLKSAMELIEAHFQELWRDLKHYLKAVLFVSLRAEYRDRELEVTSITLPNLPFVSLIGSKAARHCPPAILSPKACPVYLAENILHEATHQLVNFNILEGQLLAWDYDASLSPQIHIPWRNSAFYPRDRHWALDRCLHAMAVYMTVAHFRSKARDALTPAPYAQAHICEAIAHGLYLARELKAHDKNLCATGKGIVDSYLGLFNRMSPE